MAGTLLSDDEVFGPARSGLLSDDEVFGTAPKSGFVEGVKRFGRELAEGGRQLVQSGRAGSMAASENERKQLEYEERRAREIGDTRGADLLRERISGLGAQAQQRAASIAQSEAESTFKARPVIEAISRAKTAGEAWDAFKQDPTGAILGVTATSAAQMVPALLAGFATSGIAGVATMGASSAASEYGASLLDFARENAVDVKDAAKVQAFFQDPANLRAGMEYAGVRAGIIGAADAATGGIATRTLAPKMVTGPLSRQAVNVPTQMAVQAAGGAGGEAAAQIATKGEIAEPGAVLLEAVGELGGAPVEVAALSNEIRKGLSPQRKSLEDEIKRVLDAPDIDSAIAAANDLSRANAEVDAATAEYLGAPGSAPATEGAPGSGLPITAAPGAPLGSQRPTAADIDRQSELTQQSLTAGTEFERQSAAAQAAIARGEPRPGPAADVVDLTPMNPLQARQRLTVLRDQLAQEGGNALELQIISHPSQKGALAIGRQPLPALGIEGAGQPAPISQPAAQQRIEGAAMVGAQNQRRAAPEERGRQEIVTRALKAVEERGGVASPAEARIFQEAGVGKPYDRIDPALAPPLAEEEALTQATGIAVGRAPRETAAQPAQQPDTEGDRLAAQARANEQGFANLAAGAPFRQAARAVGEKAAADAAARPPAAPTVDSVVEALRVPPMRRGADLKARLNAARQRYSAEEMAALELQANAPATMTQEQRLTVKRLSEPRASNRRLESAGLREVSANELPSRARTSKQGKVVLHGITREVHGLLQRMGRLYGKKVVVYEGEGDSRDGFFDPNEPDTVYINRNTSKPHLVVFGHELLHSLRRSSLQTYRALEQAIRGQLKADAAEKFAEDYGQEADAEELVADLIGNRMAEEAFWAEVFNGMDAPAARKLGMAVVSAVEKAKKVVARMRGFETDALVKDLDAVKAAAVKAMREYAVLRKDAARAMPAPESVAETQQAPTVASAQQSNLRVSETRESASEKRIQISDEQPRAADGTFKAWSDEDELAAASAQQTRFSPTRNNASGESAASLEAQGRIRQEQALDRQRVLVERDGSVRALVGVNAVDQRARGAQVILQKNIGKDTWTVIEEGPEVTAPIRARAIYNAGRQRASTRRPEYGEKREGAISVTGVHYSQQQRTALDSAFAGTGLKGADLGRIERDKGEKQRIYFYVDKGQGVVPESGVGGYAHEAQLNNLYDADADPLFLAEDNPGATAFERAVTKAGFDGYYRDSFRTDVGAAVLLGKHRVDVAPAGQGARKASGEKPTRAAAPERTGWRKTLADLKASKRLPGGALDGSRWPGVIKQLEPTVYEGMLPSGVFEAVFERKGIYKSELAKEYQQRASPRREDTLARLAKFEGLLTETERAELGGRAAMKMVDIFEQLPATDQFAAAAWAGRAKRGWYRESARAIARVFGPDAPRFTALLAALSPQQSVQANLENALNVWKNWVKAGRPTTRRAIMGIMARSVQGDKGQDSVLDAWRNNSMRALTSEDPVLQGLSGPKVDSFMRNLLGAVEEVTNDAWMANFAYIDQALLSGTERLFNGERMGRKSAGYLAMSARVREAAQRLTDLTGEEWTPAEVQETVWSWTKTLYEAQNEERGSARDILYNEELTDAMIRSTPDFRGLFHDEQYAAILRSAGYGEQLRGLDQPAADAQESQPGGETAPFDSATQSRLLNEAAARLERLKAEGKPGGAATLETFTPENLPNLLQRKDWAILTASDPGAKKQSAAKNAAANARLERDLQEAGYDYLDATGKYGDEQDSYIVVGVKQKDAVALGQKYGQESVLTRAGLVYSDGRPNTPTTGRVVVYDRPPADFYTHIPDTEAYFQVELNFGDTDTASDVKASPVRKQDELVELRKQASTLRSLRKCLAS